MNSHHHFNQFLSNCCDGSATRPKSYFNNTNTSNGIVPSTTYFHPHCAVSTDNGICDGMDNCHISAPWNGYLSMPISQVPNEVPILSPFVPLRLPLDFEAASEDDFMRIFYQHQSAQHFNKVHDVNQRQVATNQLVQDRYASVELSYEVSLNRNNLDRARTPLIVVSNAEHDERVRTCIKFQDRNRKCDFKANFRDENLKADGCFFREGSKSPNGSADAIAPPKKKWIRHYMTGKEKTNKFSKYRSNLSLSCHLIHPQQQLSSSPEFKHLALEFMIIGHRNVMKSEQFAASYCVELSSLEVCCANFA